MEVNMPIKCKFAAGDYAQTPQMQRRVERPYKRSDILSSMPKCRTHIGIIKKMIDRLVYYIFSKKKD